MLGPEDFYLENGNVVLTAKFLLTRGFCCGNICKHCPYGPDIQRAASKKGLNGEAVHSRAIIGKEMGREA